MIYRSRGHAKTKLKRFSNAIWFFCIEFKVTCSVWMLILFALFVMYLWNANYPIPTISLTAELAYLNPNALRSFYGTCPYTNPMYPSIGPDIPYICPSQKPWRIGTSWYFKPDILDHREEKDDVDIKHFSETFEKVKSIIQNHVDDDAPITRVVKQLHKLHMGYLYTSCQSKEDIKIIQNKWPDMMECDEYDGIFKQYGFNGWSDATVCFDKVLCMNDDHSGGISFNLYLDSKSQQMMKQLAAKTEQIQSTKYGIDLTFTRVEQQAFHVSLGYVLNTEDFDSFDAKKLMDIVNQESAGQFGCIRLTQPPQVRAKACKNTKKLKKSIPTFDWKCEEIGF